MRAHKQLVPVFARWGRFLLICFRDLRFHNFRGVYNPRYDRRKERLDEEDEDFLDPIPDF